MLQWVLFRYSRIKCVGLTRWLNAAEHHSVFASAASASLSQSQSIYWHTQVHIMVNLLNSLVLFLLHAQHTSPPLQALCYLYLIKACYQTAYFPWALPLSRPSSFHPAFFQPVSFLSFFLFLPTSYLIFLSAALSLSFIHIYLEWHLFSTLCFTNTYTWYVCGIRRWKAHCHTFPLNKGFLSALECIRKQIVSVCSMVMSLFSSISLYVHIALISVSVALGRGKKKKRDVPPSSTSWLACDEWMRPGWGEGGDYG